MESKGNFKIDKLVDSNFHVWKQKVELVLGDRELIEHILDSDKPEDASELAQWKKNDAKAKAVIGLTLSNDLLEHVRGIETAYEMWEAITDLFQRRTLLNSLSARRRFYSVKMNDGEKALAYISRVRQLAADLKAMDVKVEDGDIAMTVLCGLPSKYEHLIVAIDAATGDSSLTMDFVKSRLLQEEQRMTDRDKSKPAPDAALVTQPNPSNKVSCSHCGKENHTEAKCWKKYPHLQPNRVGRKQTGLAAKSERQTVGDNESSDTEICLTARGRDVSENRNPNWIFDSGCTSHVCYDRRMFSDLKTCKPFVIEIGDKSGVKAIGRGCIRLVLSINGKPRNAVIKDVAYAPTMAFNLLSTRVMNREGGRSVFEENSCHVERGGKVVAEGEIRDGLYCLKTLSQACDPGTDSHTHTALAADMNLWHQRLAHVHVDGIRNMVRSGVVEGVNIDTTKHVGKCKGCVYGKSSRAPIPKLNAHRASGILDLVHTDVCGPFPEESLGGSLYFVSFIDDCSRYAWVYPIATKADVFSTFTNWLASAENLHKRKLKVLTSGKRLDKLMGESGQGDSPAKLRVLQSDNGGEYISAKMKLFLEKRGISHRLTAPGNPHQNGVAERMNRTLIELVRSMLHHKDLPKHFWAEALAVSVHVRNRVTTSGLSSKSTPYEILFGRKPNLSYLRVFGSRCWYHLGKQKVDKLDRRACEAIMIGYARGARGYKLWDIEESKVVVSRDVQFDECDDFDLTTGTSEVNVPADDIAHERTSEASAQCEKHDHSDAEADSAHSADLGDDSEGDGTPDPEDTEDTDRSDTDESTLGMERNKADDCVYVRRQGGQILIIALYVDDLLIACSDLSILNNAKRELSNRFKMKDLGESRIILGMDITRDRIKRTLSLNQSRYAQKVIERFGMSSARGQRTPMDPSLDLTDPSPLTSEPYRKAVGSLMYLMVGTRPDLAYCICTLAKYVQTPTQLKWDAVKRVIRYVIHTKHLGLVFRGTTGMKPATVYVDADWAGDVETRRSMSGFGALMTGALVAWGARQQEVVALSSAESEYISLCNGIKETIWLRRLIRGLRVVPDADKPTTVLLDNKAADALAHSSAVNRRNKHIATRFHFNRQAVQDGVVTLKYCPTEEMLADMFTKPLGRVKLQKFVADAGMNETESASTQ